MNKPVSPPSRPTGPRRINWASLFTVISAAILMGAEVFGAAYAGSWAVATLIGVSGIGIYILEVIFFACGLYIMYVFIRAARQVEPFTSTR